jgi:HPt (histidine-containing phosphotransfer) domain-containing protein
VARGVATIGGSLPAYLEALKIYCLDVEKHLPFLREFSGDEMPSFVTRVHGLKSASTNVGAASLAEMAAVLEQAGGDGDIELIRSRLDEFVGGLSRLAERIRAVLKAQASSRKGAERVDAAILEQLSAALEARNIDRIDRLIDEISTHSIDDHSREVMERISWQVLLAEFDEAVETVNELRRGDGGGAGE